MGKHFSQSERQSKVSEVARLMAGGMSQDAASKEVGASPASIRNWSKKYKAAPKRKRVAKPKFLQVEIPAVTTSMPLVILMGAPSEVAHALDRLAAIHGARQ